MPNYTYKIDLVKLCEEIGLGQLQIDPQPIQGGLLHKMFKVKTEKGEFAVKALNPQIMLRENVKKNYIFSEDIVNIVHQNKINSIPALSFGGEVIYNLDGQFYMIFPWFNGKPLEINNIDVGKCEIIGKLLAKIHRLDFSSIFKNIENNSHVCLIDWENYLKLSKKQNVEWLRLFNKNIVMIMDMERKAKDSYKKLFLNVLISHRDLDQKNVLWNEDGIPMIIDWEAAGYINPTLELLDVALYWSGVESENIDKNAFKTIIKSYLDEGGIIKDDLSDVFNASLLGKIQWLEYSIRRSLGIESNDDLDRDIGTQQVIGTINLIKRFYDNISVLVNWMEEVNR